MPIGEHPSVRLPVMICQDGFITSHALENIVLLDTDSVKAFVGEYRPEHFLLKAENPLAIGPYDLGCHYMEHKVQQAEAMKGAKKRILEVAAQFAALTGREYGLFEAYRMEDAEIALVLIGSSAGTAKVTEVRAALFAEVRAALYDLEPRPRTVGYVYGLGGRDITPAHFASVFARLEAIAAGGELGPVYSHLGQRG